jgi:hypothetical protein
VTSNEPLNLFLLLSFTDFRQREPDAGQDVPPRLMPDYITKLLKTGIVLNGVRYNFFGHSNSQSKSRSCFLYAATKDGLSEKIEALGDFSKMKSVGRRSNALDYCSQRWRLLWNPIVPWLSTISLAMTVRCNTPFDIGFLKDLPRLNVAMTRARLVS